MGHSQTIMSWTSLDAKFVLSYTTEVLQGEDYFLDLRYLHANSPFAMKISHFIYFIFCTSSYLSSTYITSSAPEADLYVFLSDFSNEFGLAGVAWLGTLCSSDKSDRISISAYLYNDIYTAEVKT